MKSRDLELSRWKVIALVTSTLLVGYLVGQSSGTLHAQTGGITKVQLDTSNCKMESELRKYGGVTPVESTDGKLISAVTVIPGTKDLQTLWVYTVCK